MRLLIVFLSAVLISPLIGKPNVVFFLVDDLGYMDIGAYNPKTFYETPNIDSLASTGVKLRMVMPLTLYAALPVIAS